MEIQEMLSRLDKIQTAVSRHGDCQKPSGDFCLTNQADEGNGWHAMNPDRMCRGCAAYWHLGCAVNELMALQRYENILAASRPPRPQ